MPDLIRMLSGIFLTVLALWLSLALLIYLFQGQLVYFPSPALSQTPDRLGLAYEDVHLTTRDGIALHGWYLPREKAPYTLLFFHGNAGNISHRLDSLAIFHQLGLSTLIIDYRGYGLSGGKPDEKGTYIDAEAAWEYLLARRQLTGGDIIIFGRSLGGGVASWLASKKNPSALILESTFTSIPDIGAELYPYLPVKLMSRIEYANIRHVQELNIPLLVIHSRDDELIPFRHGERLFKAARPPRSFLEIRGSHNDGFLQSREAYVKGIRAFIEEYVTGEEEKPGQLPSPLSVL